MKKIAFTAALILIGLSQAGCDMMRQVKIADMRADGQAQLAQAEGNRQIKRLEAQANLESAKLNAEAEVARAKGTNEANQIMAESLGGPENYLRWAYIDMLRDTASKDRSIIYLPTEAGMPILEAGKR